MYAITITESDTFMHKLLMEIKVGECLLMELNKINAVGKKDSCPSYPG